MLSRNAIRRLLGAGLIRVEGPSPLSVGPNSIDMHLGDHLKIYDRSASYRTRVFDPITQQHYQAIDPRKPPPLQGVPRRRDGRWLLVPGQFYLGCTQEVTYCRGVVPHIDGRSTCGRLSIEAHKTAGVGDNGFDGRWTLELEVTEPVLVAPGDRLFQIYFTPAWGEGLAVLIESLVRRGEFRVQGNSVAGQFDGEPVKPPRPLLELHDLYGYGDGHHYQGSQRICGAAPLEDVGNE